MVIDVAGSHGVAVGVRDGTVPAGGIVPMWAVTKPLGAEGATAVGVGEVAADAVAAAVEADTAGPALVGVATASVVDRAEAALPRAVPETEP